MARTLYYATAEGGFWSFTRKNFCEFLNHYRHSNAIPTTYGRELRRPPRHVIGCTKGGSSNCTATRNNIVLVRLYVPSDIDDAMERVCGKKGLGNCGCQREVV